MITISEELIGPAAARAIVDGSELTRGYDPCSYWIEQFNQGTYRKPADIVLGEVPIIDVAQVPLVFLSDGQLYEGKRRAVSLAAWHGDKQFPFCVIRYWDKARWPLPMSWCDNFVNGVGAKWFDFHKLCYLAVRKYYRQGRDELCLRREDLV